MKFYSTPEMELVKFQVADVITASSDPEEVQEFEENIDNID